ncbi:hypothetical protein [Halococcus sp. AFM35]|uniref:hypothetical protein n=1 Tax=Halococcus sp. AFM35 TaxID=3421653 RepID=UPI003EB727AD
MLTLDITSFMVELKDGALKNVGPSNKSAEAKLFDVTSAEAREFGDKRVKLVFETLPRCVLLSAETEPLQTVG